MWQVLSFAERVDYLLQKLQQIKLNNLLDIQETIQHYVCKHQSQVRVVIYDNQHHDAKCSSCHGGINSGRCYFHFSVPHANGYHTRMKAEPTWPLYDNIGEMTDGFVVKLEMLLQGNAFH